MVAPATERPEPTIVFNKTNILLTRLPPPQRVNPVAEGDAEIETAEIEVVDPLADDTQPHQSTSTKLEHPRPPQQHSLEDKMTSIEQVVSIIRKEFQEF